MHHHHHSWQIKEPDVSHDCTLHDSVNVYILCNTLIVMITKGLYLWPYGYKLKQEHTHQMMEDYMGLPNAHS